jgi:HPt (histidine-containing phosphotransfer) domain-containing protein
MESPDPCDGVDKAALADAIDCLWRRFLPEILRRVAVLEEAAAAKNITSSRREAAQSAAHKLAGVLGTFGLTRGTVLARELELTFARESAAEPASDTRLIEATRQLRIMIENRPSAS